MDDAVRSEVKFLADDLHDFVFGQPAGAEGVDHDGHGTGDADGIGDLDLHLVGIACRDKVFGDIAGGICGAAVNLGAVLAGEGAAAVAGKTAVGVDDDLAAGEACVSVGAADDEASGGIDVVFGVFVDHIGRDHLIDDVFAHVSVDLFLGGLGRVLGREDDRLDTDCLAVLVIFDGDLSLSVRAEVGKGAVLADLRQPAGQGVGEGDGHGHVLFRLVGGKAEHHALVAGAGLEVILQVAFLECAVDAHGDVGGLAVECDHDGAGVGVKADIRAGVADLPDGVADDLLIIDDRIGRDLAADDHKAGGSHGLTGDAAHGVLREAGIENGIRDRVTDLVGMSLCHGFRCKNKFTHEAPFFFCGFDLCFATQHVFLFFMQAVSF